MYKTTEKFDTLLPRPGSGKRILKSKLLLALGATDQNRPFPGNTEGIIERKIILQNTFNPNASGGGSSGIIACATGTTFAMAWAARVVANGGAAPSVATQQAIATFQCGLVTDGLDTQMRSWNVFASDNLIAAITPQLLGGGSDPWINHNFVLADLSVLGLVGNGTTKYLDTGLDPLNNVWGGNNPTTSVGITLYVETNNNGNNVLTAVSNGAFTTNFIALETFAGSTSFVASSSNTTLTAANAGFTGYISGNMITATPIMAIYEANSGVAHNTLASSGAATQGGAPTGFKIPVFAQNDNTGISNFSNQRLGAIFFHFGLTNAQSALFFARVQTLMSALGRAI